MNLFRSTYNKINENRNNIIAGKKNNIPFPFIRFNKHVPGIIRGTNYIVTSGSGTGKTQLTKFLFVYSAYKYYKSHPEELSLKIFYFALEESKEEMMISLISNYLYEVHRIEISPIEIQSYGNKIFDKDIIDKIYEARGYFKELMISLEVVDYIFHPTGIYKHVEDYALRNGSIIYRKAIKVDNDGNIASIKIPHHYQPINEKEYVIVITDHVSLMAPEKGKDLRETLGDWSFRYGRKKLTKLFKYIVVNVQQQSAESEKQQFDIKGGNIVPKLLPSLTNLANNKETQRDAFVIFGLFSPYRFKLTDHNGYNISVLKDNYRALYVLKNRYGGQVVANLLFNGATNVFKELPRVDDIVEMKKIYQSINNSKK